ncbi:helix-turn-helix domain-containing protein [Leucobacter sp. M11]|uniref:helix-turn-helix domain-containing protein n=1 Tax=Leucobacter sp. M11 TaxID=2993565 RepID=UPI002D800DE3|nr:helix-turn-helix transcriptional regulator [Leucobacter sp. M11]MEB4616343.1 helix-turn-helix transcriptional regulator [Leucobacter sp. M11]
MNTNDAAAAPAPDGTGPAAGASSTLGQRIGESRRLRGWTQDDLARKLRVTPQAVSKWETDQSIPDPSLFVPLADALGVGLDDLMRDPASPAPPVTAVITNGGGSGSRVVTGARAKSMVIVTTPIAGAEQTSGHAHKKPARVTVPLWLIGAGIGAAQGFLPESLRGDIDLTPLRDAITKGEPGVFLEVEEADVRVTISLE